MRGPSGLRKFKFKFKLSHVPVLRGVTLGIYMIVCKCIYALARMYKDVPTLGCWFRACMFFRYRCWFQASGMIRQVHGAGGVFEHSRVILGALEVRPAVSERVYVATSTTRSTAAQATNPISPVPCALAWRDRLY